MKLTFQIFSESLEIPKGLPKAQNTALTTARNGILAASEPIFQRTNVPGPVLLSAIGLQYQHWGDAFTQICGTGVEHAGGATG